MNQDSECECPRCELSRKFEAICAKMGKRDREWMMGFHGDITHYVAHLEGILDAIGTAQDGPKRLPRRGEERMRRR